MKGITREYRILSGTKKGAHADQSMSHMKGKIEVNLHTRHIRSKVGQICQTQKKNTCPTCVSPPKWLLQWGFFSSFSPPEEAIFFGVWQILPTFDLIWLVWRFTSIFTLHVNFPCKKHLHLPSPDNHVITGDRSRCWAVYTTLAVIGKARMLINYPCLLSGVLEHPCRVSCRSPGHLK